LLPSIRYDFDFYRSHLTIRLIQKIYENTKIIMIYLNIYDDKTCHSKINNIFTIFSNKTNLLFSFYKKIPVGRREY
jgi:hypothetical protein